MIINEDFLKKLVGKNFRLTFCAAGNVLDQIKKGGYLITDTGDQFIEAKKASSDSTKRYYFNIATIVTITLL